MEDEIKRKMAQAVSKGIKDLWQQELFFDYTIRCERQEFQVHKIVLTSGSDYFRTMLTSDFKESSEDSVELKAVSATGMKEVLGFLYTSEIEIDRNNCSEILATAVYLQIQPAIDICCFFLLENLDFGNCFDILELLNKYQIGTAAGKVKEYINDVLRYENQYIEGLPVEDFKQFMNYWSGPRWELYLLITEWIYCDLTRKRYLDGLMQSIEFSLLPLEHLEEIARGYIFNSKFSDRLKERVVSAIEEYNLPIWDKVDVEISYFPISHQRQLVAFTTDGGADTVVCGSELHTLELEEGRYSWCKRKIPHITEDICKNGSVAVFNDFLIVAGGYEPTSHLTPSKRCYIFDPRQMKWSRIRDMKKRRVEFPLFVCGYNLYALGGCSGDPINADMESGITSDCEIYCFYSNKWSPFPGLPRALRGHSACFLGSNIYVSGGLTCGYETRKLRSRRISLQPNEVSRELNTYDTLTKTWISKAPMIEKRFGHSLFPMCLSAYNEEVIMAIGRMKTMEYYVPSTNQWTTYTPCISQQHLESFPIYGTKVAFDYKRVHFLKCRGACEGYQDEDRQPENGDAGCAEHYFQGSGEDPDIYLPIPTLPADDGISVKTAQFCAFLRLPHDIDEILLSEK